MFTPRRSSKDRRSRDNQRTRNRTNKGDHEKESKKLEIEKIDELGKLHEKLRFATVNNRFWERPNSTEEKIELRKITKTISMR